jgi:hypothetical protein
MFCFRQRELGDRRAEAELEPLQHDRMAYCSLLSTPAEYSVTQDNFHAFRFAFDAAIKLVKILEYLHRGSGGLLVFRPLVSMCLPLVEYRHPFGIAAESHTHSSTRGPLVYSF